MTSDAPDVLLTPYRGALTGPLRRRLARALLGEALASCACGRGAARHALESVYAAVFSAPCGPAGAGFAEHLAVARYVVLFFLVDDGPAGEARALADRLRRGDESGEDEPGRQLRALLDGLRARGADRDRLVALLADFCSAVAEEAAADLAAEPLPPDRLLHLRARTIGVLPYAECLRLVQGLPPPDPGSADDRLVVTAVEAVYLANDLFSAAVEGRAGPRPPSGNTVLALARSGEGPRAAAEGAVARYNELVRGLAAAQDRPFAVLLARVVDGNRAAYGELAATRYPGAPLELLPLLDRVRPDDPPS
ncbi:terpene synthase family protein [Kitasatospora sp. NPDC002965]|uniref:terpene synthase family protein n=1 Tax=Kitasatospora sp. NPDC002965 TaxID=3154775 RepID=UPI0033BBDDF3